MAAWLADGGNLDDFTGAYRRSFCLFVDNDTGFL
jgi:hypothetical protein